MTSCITWKFLQRISNGEPVAVVACFSMEEIWLWRTCKGIENGYVKWFKSSGRKTVACKDLPGHRNFHCFLSENPHTRRLAVLFLSSIRLLLECFSCSDISLVMLSKAFWFGFFFLMYANSHQKKSSFVYLYSEKMNQHQLYKTS